MKRNRRKSRLCSHMFVLKYETNDGEERIITSRAKVFVPRKRVDLRLAAEHVARSIKLGGVGNTQTCSMAVCAKQQAALFDHAVDGLIDWTYRRAWVVSKCSRQGLPTECYVYEHDDGIGRLNDTPGGQRKLLRQLQKDGDRVIHLRPPRNHSSSTHGPTKSGSEGTHVARRFKGAKLRYAVAHLGGVPA